MTDKAFPRQAFRPEVTFVVQRPMLLSGKEVTPGTIFDKALVTPRKLRQLYDQRYLRFWEAGDPSIEPPKARPKVVARLSRARASRQPLETA